MTDPDRYAVELAHFRAEIDEMLEMHPQSPLSYEQQQQFEGLDYYEPDPAFRFSGEAERFGDDEPLIEMQTSTGDTRHYRRWGRFAFDVEGEGASLVIYQDPMHGDFFLPFKDATNGGKPMAPGATLTTTAPAAPSGR
jgi:uncharacterized protein